MTQSVLSFGLVSIPVKVQLAAHATGSCFQWLSPQRNRISVEYIDSVTGEKVERADILHGVEVVKDKFITLTGDEIKALSVDRSNGIQIQQVIPFRTLPYHMVEKVYYLTPIKIHKSYRLLHHCLHTTSRAVVGKWYARGRDYLVALYATSELLVMLQLYYQAELKEVHTTFAKGSEPSRQEVTLANDLLDNLASTGFDAASYQDEYAQRLRAAVEAKQAGQPNLATLLRKSLKGKSNEGRAKRRKGRAGGRRR